MFTPVETSYSFLTICTWFQTMSTPYETSNCVPDSLYLVQNQVYYLKNVLQLTDCLYCVLNHVYSNHNVLQLPNSLYLVPNHVYSLRNILQLPYSLYLVLNHV